MEYYQITIVAIVASLLIAALFIRLEKIKRDSLQNEMKNILFFQEEKVLHFKMHKVVILKKSGWEIDSQKKNFILEDYTVPIKYATSE
ncbi:MAG: hypothetical protein COA66_10470 [Arcobacter sp.]|nr:MAG: hypothetical protein COA66_10470 [Arcobacter sp.]